MIHKTIKWIVKDQPFKILGSGRTDARVSALEAAFELFIDREPIDEELFLKALNENFPADIRALSLRKTDQHFNIINQAKTKEYLYLFSFGKKNHPFAAPFMTNIQHDLNITLMQEAARIFEGTHNFTAYCARSNEATQTTRTLNLCRIEPNVTLSANFFPKESYQLRIKGPGFGRYQVRLIMGALFGIGKGDFTVDFIRETLEENYTQPMTWVAPGSGLILNSIDFEGGVSSNPSE